MKKPKKVAKKKVTKKSKALAKAEPKKEIQLSITSKTIDDFLFGSDTKLNDQQKMLFKQTAIASQLNPFKREVYAVPFKDKMGHMRMTIMTGYEVYLKRAEGSGRLVGWKTWTEGTTRDGNLKACIEIHRKDFTKSFCHEVYLTEYHQHNKMWNEKPMTMIKKVAMAQGFRLAFPATLAGMPYTSDEMPMKEEPKNVTPNGDSEPEVLYNEEQKALLEKIKSACDILGIDGAKCLTKFSLTTFRDVTVEKMKEIEKKLQTEIESMNKQTQADYAQGQNPNVD